MCRVMPGYTADKLNFFLEGRRKEGKLYMGRTCADYFDVNTGLPSSLNFTFNSLTSTPRTGLMPPVSKSTVTTHII